MTKSIHCIFFCISILIMGSCSKQVEIYSCDKNIDDFVKNNLHEIRQMDRVQWNKIDHSIAVAVYRAFTPEQKKHFWNDKLAEVKLLSWNDLEVRHIQDVETFLNTHPNIFRTEGLSQKEEDEIDLFFYKWVKEAESDLGWSKELAYSIVATGYSVENKQGELRINVSEYPNETDGLLSTNTDCNCNQEHDFCPNAHDCASESCKTDTHGCGWVWVQKCNGKCRLEGTPSIEITDSNKDNSTTIKP